MKTPIRQILPPLFFLTLTLAALPALATAIDAAALWTQLESTPKGRELLHGKVVSNQVVQTVNTNAMISVKEHTAYYADGFVHVSVTTNAFQPRTNRARVAPPNSPSRYQQIVELREAAGWYAQPPEERPPKVKTYSVMRCVLAAKSAGVWDDKVKPFLADAGLIDLVYTAQEFRSDDPNFAAAISAIERMGITRETIDAALESAEIK